MESETAAQRQNSARAGLPSPAGMQARDGHRAADQEGDRNVTVTKLLRDGIKCTAIRDLVR